jgi:hypothetical protein
MLPAFQVQVPISTGDSGSNPERALYRQILLIVNDLRKKTIRDVNAVMELRNLSLGKTFFKYLVDRSFATECFCMKHETSLLLRK